MDYIQIFTTTERRADADKLSRMLISKRLAACVQVVGPTVSYYKWKGRNVKSKEWLCIIKTKKTAYKKVERELKRMHPYELPEIVATQFAAGSKEYFAWVSERLRKT